jgi:heme-degrading monooxygenase HmoA
MFARVTTVHFKPDTIDQAIKIYNESVVPSAKAQKGFKRILLFLDRETGRGLTIAFWETQEDAAANEKSLYYQEQLTKFLPFYKAAPVKEGFEVIVDAG